MPKHRVYIDEAARQAAYRRRAAAKRKRDATNLDGLMQRLAFIRDTAGDVSRDSVKNRAGWRGSAGDYDPRLL
jgi:hypothetical protein